MQPIVLAEDRSLRVPAGQLVVTGYVPIDSIRFACRDRMAIGDVERALNRRLQLGVDQPWPCPRGEWVEHGRFVVYDGRHDVVAALMLGVEFVLCAWPGDAK